MLATSIGAVGWFFARGTPTEPSGDRALPIADRPTCGCALRTGGAARSRHRPIDLGETRQSIERRLGTGRRATDGISVEYRAPAGPILVGYDSLRRRSARAAVIQSSSSRYRFRGLSLRSGFRRITRGLSGWHSARCDKVGYVFWNETPTGPSSAWGYDRLLGARVVVQSKPWVSPCSYLGRGEN